MAPTPKKDSSGSKLKQRIGFIGGGQMAQALAKGFMANGLVAPDQVLASAPSDTNLVFWRNLGASTTNKNSDVILNCDIIFLAVKPHIFHEMMAALELDMQEGGQAEGGPEAAPAAAATPKGNGPAAALGGDSKSGSSSTSPTRRYLTQDSKLFVSVMAGLTLRTLDVAVSNIAPTPRIIRTMPNTPATVGCGCTVYSLGENATETDGQLIEQLFNTVGSCEQTPERLQDAFSGMAGSGPAYIYLVIEALADGGVKMGLPRKMANKFAAQMTMGAAKMAFESDKHTGQLREDVCSPGGSTIRAMHVLERAGVRAALMDAVQASAERSIEMGQKNKD